MELQVLNNQGQKSGSVEFEDALINVKASPALLHEFVVAFRAGLRAGTHKTKTRSFVSGGGIKPWRQKGTGRARSGSTRSPLWRHGGIVFGPEPRDYRQSLPKAKKKTAFRMAVKECLEKNRLQVVDPITLSETKTKVVANVFKSWAAPVDSLFVVQKVDAALERASRNINSVQILNVESLNAYDCLKARKIFITKDALTQLTSRMKQKEEPARQEPESQGSRRKAGGEN